MINFLWSPLIDRTKLPFLYNWLGQRRSWILFCQSFILLGTLLLAGLDLKANLAIAAALCLLIAIASATQDIAIDAFRIDTLSENESHKATAAAAMATSGWWTVSSYEREEPPKFVTCFVKCGRPICV